MDFNVADAELPSPYAQCKRGSHAASCNRLLEDLLTAQIDWGCLDIPAAVPDVFLWLRQLSEAVLDLRRSTPVLPSVITINRPTYSSQSLCWRA